MHSDASSPVTSKPSRPLSQAEIPALDTYFPPPKQPSIWSRARGSIREPMAEFIGVTIFFILGTGVGCQVVLSTNPAIAPSPKGDFLSINIGWGIGLALGAWVSGGISGAHLNPALTLAFATWRGFPWRKVPGYIFAQILGASIGSALVYGNYFHAIDIFEGGSGIRTRATASLFATYALDYVTPVACFFCEFLGTAVLALVVLAATDKKNNAPPQYLTPLILFFVLLGLGAALGMQTAYALNPVRDFGPRLFLSMAGYGKQLYTYRSQYWLWCPIVAPVLGAQAGMGLYVLFLHDNGDGPAFQDEKTRDLSGTPGTPMA